jgi:hypothetical protein
MLANPSSKLLLACLLVSSVQRVSLRKEVLGPDQEAMGRAVVGSRQTREQPWEVGC